MQSQRREQVGLGLVGLIQHVGILKQRVALQARNAPAKCCTAPVRTVTLLWHSPC